jgi:hypothetical protein
VRQPYTNDMKPKEPKQSQPVMPDRMNICGPGGGITKPEDKIYASPTSQMTLRRGRQPRMFIPPGK